MVDLRRNDGLSNRNNVNDLSGRRDINSASNSDDGSDRNDKDRNRRNGKEKSKNRSDSDSDNNNDDDDDDDDLNAIIEGEKAISDAAYIAGNEQNKLSAC